MSQSRSEREQVMRVFRDWEIDEAIAYAAQGGQALHLHRVIVDESRAPRCFVQAVRRGEDIAHLFDQDAGRLARTARRLGVRVIKIERTGTARQHLDLCGKPLQRAIGQCGDKI